MSKQVFNPYLPLDVYIPDGEPHVFGDRLYIFGSHDGEGADKFCVLDYEVWSAPVTDLTDWRCEGTIYRAKQDPLYGKPNRQLYAPDVVQGNDGRYYLYYALSGGTFTDPIHVAVCDTPAGQYEYYGEVRNPDGTTFRRHITFNPGLINDNGNIYLYYGWSLGFPKEHLDSASAQFGGADSPSFKEQLLNIQIQMFGKTREEILSEPDGIMGANVVRLADDMLTVIEGPSRILPGQFSADGTEFENHAFFEASSIRRIGDLYYFIYSSQVQHELCYAISTYPDRDFRYGGVIISNGDIGYKGRKAADRLAMSGNDHGSILCVNGQWYIFYHRQTHKTTFSRQGCAEKITILPDGFIPQVEMTSCGLNSGPLKTEGTYTACIACNLTDGHMPHTGNTLYEPPVPHITNEGSTRYIAEITDGSLIGYKYFRFDRPVTLSLIFRGMAEGTFSILADENLLGTIPVAESSDWIRASITADVYGDHALYFIYHGEGMPEIKEFSFS